MKHKLVAILVVLFGLVLAGTTLNAQESKEEKSCAGGCCGSGDKELALANMQDHNQHKREQNKKDSSAKKEEMKIPTEYTCPMHPEVKSDKPGTCPKCGMALVEVKKEKKSLMKQKMEAMKDGKYNCCTEEPCDECLKAHGSCSCKKSVQNGKPVCNECYEGWKRGEGDVSGKTFKDIKKGHDHKH